jgi:hypothetical protein
MYLTLLGHKKIDSVVSIIKNEIHKAIKGD